MLFNSLVIHLCSTLIVVLLLPLSLQNNEIKLEKRIDLTNHRGGHHQHRHHSHYIGPLDKATADEKYFGMRRHRELKYVDRPHQAQNGPNTVIDHKVHRRRHHHRHHHQKHCRQCRPGHFVQQSCNQTQNTVCAPCPQQTYSAHNSMNLECISCSKCGIGLYVLHQCTPISDTVCDSCQSIKTNDYSVKCA